MADVKDSRPYKGKKPFVSRSGANLHVGAQHESSAGLHPRREKPVMTTDITLTVFVPVEQAQKAWALRTVWEQEHIRVRLQTPVSRN